MSALGQKQTSAVHQAMSASPPIAILYLLGAAPHHSLVAVPRKWSLKPLAHPPTVP